MLKDMCSKNLQKYKIAARNLGVLIIDSDFTDF